MKIYYVKLIQMRLGILKVEPHGEEIRLFSSLDETEKWLAGNGFVYGQRYFFNYPTGDREWFHKDDIPVEYIDVVIKEMEVDNLADSKFKDLGKIHREWLSQIQ